MIELINLYTGYSKDKIIHENFNYKFGNEIHGILGQSGCGKTTLLRTMSGLLKPINGTVLIDGKPVGKPSQNNVYMMHQNYTSFDWLKSLDNVLISKKIKCKRVSKEDVEDAEQMLERVGLYEHRNKYPRELSGGMRQRLALARTLFMKPEIILMDEPLSALDDDTRKEMQDLIIEIHRETRNTVIMVTHSHQEAKRMCDNILTL